MPNIEAISTPNLRKTLLKLEILEVSALIGTGGFALWQSELLPTVMVVGTLAGIAAWHKIRGLKDQKSNQTALSLSPTGIIEKPEPPPIDDVQNVQDTLQAIYDGDLDPSIKANSKHARRRIKKRLKRTLPRHS